MPKNVQLVQRIRGETDGDGEQVEETKRQGRNHYTGEKVMRRMKGSGQAGCIGGV